MLYELTTVFIGKDSGYEVTRYVPDDAQFTWVAIRFTRRASLALIAYTLQLDTPPVMDAPQVFVVESVMTWVVL